MSSNLLLQYARFPFETIIQPSKLQNGSFLTGKSRSSKTYRPPAVIVRGVQPTACVLVCFPSHVSLYRVFKLVCHIVQRHVLAMCVLKMKFVATLVLTVLIPAISWGEICPPESQILPPPPKNTQNIKNASNLPRDILDICFPQNVESRINTGSN